MKTLKDLIGDRYGVEAECGGDMAAEGALAGILARGSQRHYKPDPVPDDLLRVLLACAQSAPTKSDLQQYSIIVVKDPALRESLSELRSGMDWPPLAPLFLVFCADMRRIQRLAEIRGHDHANNNVDTFMNGIVDAALAMQCFINAAEAAGLGVCPISQIRNKMDTVRDLLSLPPGVFPIAGLAGGWPQFETPRISLRLPQSVVVHTDRYNDDALSEDVESYDQRRHAHTPLPEAKQRHVDLYGALEYCPWSENVTRQLSKPERAGFKDFLQKHGFDLA